MGWRFQVLVWKYYGLEIPGISLEILVFMVFIVFIGFANVFCS